jgi:hypothetical protein
MNQVHPIPHLYYVVLLLAGFWLLAKGIRILRRRAKTTQLRGPPSRSLIFGNSRFLGSQTDVAHIYEEWAEQYGAVFCVPTVLGGTTVMICDPKAIQHCYSRETYGYVQNPMGRAMINDMVFILSRHHNLKKLRCM